MKNVFDIAFYILDKCGPMSAMKLQKLVYYSQAWSLVWDDKALFKEKIEAWANGPVVPKLYDVHRGMFTVNKSGVAEKTTGKDLSEQQKETIDTVISAYAGKSAQWLSDQTHAEEPWCLARAGMSDNERGNSEITLASMSEYYSSL